MNSYASIEKYGKYRRLGYFSLKSEDKDYTETDDFFDRMEEIAEIQNQLERFVYWMEVVGDNGIENGSFRNEGICEALPPEIEFSHEKIELRLYCYVVSNNVVILFNGDWKTPGARSSQDCERVWPHHKNAMAWTKRLRNEDMQTKNKEIVNRGNIFINY